MEARGKDIREVATPGVAGMRRPAGGIQPQEAIRLLAADQGPIQWRPRYDPVSELMFTVLSQHTSDLNAERAFHRLMESFGSWEAVAQGDVDRIAQCINVGGLARVKAPRLKAILKRILELRGTLDLSFLKGMSLEEAKAWLRGLPGVGPKTAAVVLCFSLGMPAMPVDTHVYRVAKRLGFIGEKTTPEQAHDILEGMVEPEQVFAFHVHLITHGRRVCKAPRPLCHQCVLAHGCPSRQRYLAPGTQDGAEQGTGK